MIHQPRVPAGTGGPPEDWAEPGAQPWELAWADQPKIALALGGEPLSLDQTLGCGQAFRWQPRGPEAWEGVAGNRAWRLERSAGVLYARVVPALPADEARQFLSRYFALDLAAAEIAAAVGAAHPAAARAAEQFEGLRILRQEPLETLLTFAIATATNVPRVTRSVAAVCTRFGDRIATVDGVDYHAFPRPQQLLAAPTADLFGPCNLAYRARSLQALCAALPAEPEEWLTALQVGPYKAAHRAVDALPFYGPKVSDCACLFGLGFSEAVPVDVHVWAIAHELFGTEIPTRTLTPRTYAMIGDWFRERFGRWAGWAQQYLFCARRSLPITARFRPGDETRRDRVPPASRPG